jgi:hypothetical protein
MGDIIERLEEVIVKGGVLKSSFDKAGVEWKTHSICHTKSDLSALSVVRIGT